MTKANHMLAELDLGMFGWVVHCNAFCYSATHRQSDASNQDYCRHR
jgi:hypothetical protein